MQINLSSPLLLTLLITSLILSLGAFVLAISYARGQKRLLNQYRILLANGSPQDIESLLLGQSRSLEELSSNLSRLSAQVLANEQQARQHIQRVGMVRYNAFPDTGSDQSFSVALLDAEGNGLVLSSLYGRTETRTYAKPLVAGKSTYPLSDEEEEALAKAKAV